MDFCADCQTVKYSLLSEKTIYFPFSLVKGKTLLGYNYIFHFPCLTFKNVKNKVNAWGMFLFYSRHFYFLHTFMSLCQSIPNFNRMIEEVRTVVSASFMHSSVHMSVHTSVHPFFYASIHPLIIVYISVVFFFSFVLYHHSFHELMKEPFDELCLEVHSKRRGIL